MENPRQKIKSIKNPIKHFLNVCISLNHFDGHFAYLKTLDFYFKGVSKLQVLVYDILPPTSAIVDYAIGLEKLSANEQFFDDAQTAVSL